jgi:hypothetical protein
MGHEPLRLCADTSARCAGDTAADSTALYSMYTVVIL